VSRSRPVVLNSKAKRQTAANWCMNVEDGTVIEFRAAKRTDAQNDALHGLIDQIIKQRPIHNGVKMNKTLWKAVFMQAWGAEITFVPTLDGDGMFPMGLRTSELGVAQCADLITFILAWTAREGLTVEHFDEAPNQTEAA
jgi:hypothetical protein